MTLGLRLSADGGGLADFDFHSALVRASRSDTLMQLYSALATLLTRSHRNRRRAVGGRGDAIKRTVVEDHRRLLGAVVSGDADAADLALRRHFHIGDELRRQRALAPARTAKSPLARHPGLERGRGAAAVDCGSRPQ